MQKFKLENKEYIELNSLLKICGVCGSGGIAKLMIADACVKVNNNIELRKRCKIRKGDVVEVKGERIQVE